MKSTVAQRPVVCKRDPDFEEAGGRYGGERLSLGWIGLNLNLNASLWIKAAW
jgi:hypothetical protein